MIRAACSHETPADAEIEADLQPARKGRLSLGRVADRRSHRVTDEGDRDDLLGGCRARPWGEGGGQAGHETDDERALNGHGCFSLVFDARRAIHRHCACITRGPTASTQCVNNRDSTVNRKTRTGRDGRRRRGGHPWSRRCGAAVAPSQWLQGPRGPWRIGSPGYVRPNRPMPPILLRFRRSSTTFRDPLTRLTASRRGRENG